MKANITAALAALVLAALWLAGGLLLPAPTRAQEIGAVLRAVPLGYQQITVLTASTALTVPTGTTMAVITPETQAVRWRDDGVAPSATVGMPLAVGAQLLYSGNLGAIRFFEQAASAKLNVSYYRTP